jgi:hypothetical protein
MYLIIILLCILLIFYLCDNKIEPYYNITPYNLHWNVYKCLTDTCVRDKSYKCYEYCKYIKESGAHQQCEVECLDIGDEVMDFLKYQNYNWPMDPSNAYMKNYTVLNDTDDYVNVDTNKILPNQVDLSKLPVDIKT